MECREDLGLDPVEKEVGAIKGYGVEVGWLRLNSVLKGALWGLQQGQTVRDQGLTQGTWRSQRRRQLMR